MSISTRTKWIWLGVVVLVFASASGFAIVKAAQDQAEKTRPTAATALDKALDRSSALDVPHVVFRSTAMGPTYGMVGSVPLADPDGARWNSGIACERIAATRTSAVCLAADRGLVTKYHGEILDGMLKVKAKLPVDGVPSRARLSLDGSLLATTVFVGGHGYGSIGFSTLTQIRSTDGQRSYGNLEKTFTTLIKGRRVVAKDLNVWGVTFAPGDDPDTFYATIATRGKTWLARGSLDDKTLTALQQDAECPSLSPDGKLIVFKKRDGSPIRWRYFVLELASGRQQPLAETRSIDDQAEWLNDHEVLYGVPRSGTGSTDVWVVDVRGGAEPRVFIPDAWSATVVPGPAIRD